MLALGTPAPEFELTDVRTGKPVRLRDKQPNVATLVMFICNHCPYVKHVLPELVRLANDYQPKGIWLVAISSNDVERYPEDGPDQMKRVAAENGFSFPYLYDETQEVARAYDAACTPDFYVFDQDLHLVYRGQLDDSRPKSSVPLTGQDIRAALDQLIAGKPVSQNQQPSIGCSIKWKV